MLLTLEEFKRQKIDLYDGQATATIHKGNMLRSNKLAR